MFQRLPAGLLILMASFPLTVSCRAHLHEKPPTAEQAKIQVRHEPIVDMLTLNPNVLIDIKYATKENFTGKILYPDNICRLRESTAKKLAAAQSALERRGLGLKVWDCYRPLEVQKKLWKLVPDERYVANPNKGSRHNRGAAVDVTLIDFYTKKEVAMPTPYDDFTEKAHRSDSSASTLAITNRDFLEKVMSDNGFVGLETEWWHFDDSEWMAHPIE